MIDCMPDQLVAVIKRLIMNSKDRGEDTIGILMKCGAFHESLREDFVVMLADAVESSKLKCRGYYVYPSEANEDSES